MRSSWTPPGLDPGTPVIRRTSGRRGARAGGACIGGVYEAELSDGSKAVAKVDRAGESHLEREAYMLRYLGDKSDLPVPKAYHHSEKLLLMEFVEGGGNLSGAEG